MFGILLFASVCSPRLIDRLAQHSNIAEGELSGGYPRLQVLELLIRPEELLRFLSDISHEPPVEPFIPESPLKTLKIPSLWTRERTRADWEDLDLVLQRPCFSSLEQLVCNFYIMFRSSDTTQQAKSLSYAAPDECSPVAVALGKDIARLETRLPRCSKRGIIAPNVKYSFIPDPVVSSRCVLHSFKI